MLWQVSMGGIRHQGRTLHIINNGFVRLQKHIGIINTQIHVWITLIIHKPNRIVVSFDKVRGADDRVSQSKASGISLVLSKANGLLPGRRVVNNVETHANFQDRLHMSQEWHLSGQTRIRTYKREEGAALSLSQQSEFNSNSLSILNVQVQVSCCGSLGQKRYNTHHHFQPGNRKSNIIYTPDNEGLTKGENETVVLNVVLGSG